MVSNKERLVINGQKVYIRWHEKNPNWFGWLCSVNGKSIGYRASRDDALLHAVKKILKEE